MVVVVEEEEGGGVVGIGEVEGGGGEVEGGTEVCFTFSYRRCRSGPDCDVKVEA